MRKYFLKIIAVFCSVSLLTVSFTVEAKGKGALRATNSVFSKSLKHNTNDKIGRQQRLRELANNTKIGKAERGWIKQEMNAVKRSVGTLKQRFHIRNPPQTDLAHSPGREAAKGYSYKYADLRPRALHRFRHTLDKYGRKNKERPVSPSEK
jgi:hypothetical protein